MKPTHPATGERAAPIADAESEPDFTPVPVLPRANGWTAERQRTFLVVLAETGSIREACIHSGVSSRSAYRLRARPDAASFCAAWDQALKLATTRLTALAFERATVGTTRETWRGGELVSQSRAPSDKLLMFLLAHLLPAGRPGERWAGFERMAADARTGFPGLLDTLTDNDVELVPLQHRDLYPACPLGQT
jgi:hypothetical protein